MRKVKILCRKRRNLQELLKRTGGGFMDDLDGVVAAGASLAAAAATATLHQATQDADGHPPPGDGSGDDIVQRNNHDQTSS